jgi:hypothetical protein
MTQAWWFHAVAVVIPDAAARAMLDGAGRSPDVEAASDARSATLWLWSGPRGLQGARRVGSVSLLWGVPSAEEATIGEIAWDVAHGSEDAVWRQIEALTRAKVIR